MWILFGRIQQYILSSILRIINKHGETLCILLCLTLGNTGTGKSSLSRTLKYYTESPNEPRPFLTGDPKNEQFKKTKVLEILPNLKFSARKSVLTMTATGRFVKVNKIAESEESTEQKVNVTVTDFGGDNEYYLASRLFFVDNGIFMIMFNTASVAPENLTSNVGNYLDLVLQNSENPVICLVAAKSDLVREEAKDLSFVAKWVQNYIKFLLKDEDSSTREMKVFLYDKVLLTSSKVPQREWLETMSQLLTSMITNKDIIKSQQEVIPLSWNLFLKELMKDESSELDMSRVEEIFKKVKETAPPLNVNDNGVKEESIKSLQQVLSESEDILWVERVIKRHEERLDKQDGKKIDSRKEEQGGAFQKKDDMEKGEKEKAIYVPESSEYVANENNAQYAELEYDKYSSGVELVIQFFTDLGDVLRFSKIDTLKEKVFTRPMKLIEDCRLENQYLKYGVYIHTFHFAGAS